MLAIIKKPNEDAFSMEIDESLSTYQEIVGGYIEVVSFGVEHLIILNEEGRLDGLTPNINWSNDVIVGTIILVRNEAPDFGPLKEEEVRYMIQMLNKASV